MTMDGMDGRAKVTVLLTGGALSLDAAFAAVVSPACGGTALFVGTTRSPNQGREVEELEYEAYQELARPALERVARAVAARHGLGAVYLAHRVGAVPRAEPSVILAAGGSCATCGSRSPTAATSAACTACPPKGCRGCPPATCSATRSWSVPCGSRWSWACAPSASPAASPPSGATWSTWSAPSPGSGSSSP